MTRTSIFVIVAVIVLAALVGGYFLYQPPGDQSAAAVTTTDPTPPMEVTEVTQEAIDFCTETGGTVETVTAAEGAVHLCLTADGTKIEVGQYMKDMAAQ